MITSLRKRRLQDDGPGKPYERRLETTAQLEELSVLSRNDLVERCALPRGNPGYVETECLLYFVRRTRVDNSDSYFDRLYGLLMKRVLKRLPKAESAGGRAESFNVGEIRDKMFERFVTLVAEDHRVYSEKLDFYEIRFESALAGSRKDAERKVWREDNRRTSLSYDDESGDLSKEVEEAAGECDPFDVARKSSTNYRLRLDPAIDTLPPEQRRIVEMVRLGIPIDSNETFAVTISKTLDRSEKTIRTHRNLAFRAIERFTKDGDDR
ncbi:DNA-binding response regulator [Methylobacterium sp. C25]|uniref:DNA-binding response regulator n=1 Tax=Methylobacterium sp. C25 TaxID=2721622 RepID=UPI001F188AE3|nr:DNA-binding response regulator [Methylobacterium sp. C25]